MIGFAPLLLVTLLVGAQGASAAPPEPRSAAFSKRVSIEFRGSLRDALKQIASKGGLNLVVTGNLDQDAEVYLRNVSPEEALRTVAAAYNLRIQQNGSIWTLRPMTPEEIRSAPPPLPQVAPTAGVVRPPPVPPVPSQPAVGPAPLDNVKVPAPTLRGLPSVPEVIPGMGEKQLDQVMRLAEEAAERAEAEAEAIMEKVTEHADEVVERATEELEKARELTNEKAIGIRERALEQAEQAREQAREQAEAAREHAREIREQAREARQQAREALRAGRHRGKHNRAGTGPVTVREGEVVESAVAYGGPLVVEGHVEDDAVAFGGDVTLGPKAWVEGDVVAFGGSIHRADTAMVEGDATAFGGSVIGAAIARGIAEAAERPRHERDAEPHRHGTPTIVSALIWFIALFAIGFIASLLIPSRMKLIEGEIKSNPLKAGLAGLVAALALLPLTVLLVITIIGIPVAAALWLIAPLAAAVGFTAVASEIGMRLPVFRGRKTRALVLAVGLALLLGAALIPVVGPIAVFLLGLIGFGAIVRTRFGSRAAGPKPSGPMPTSDIPSGVPV
jgi:uncharacterized membrane protein YccF (DUF307 family)